MTFFMAAIPMSGIAAMKNVTVTLAPSMGLPLFEVSFTRTVLLPFCGGDGSVVSSIMACAFIGLFMVDWASKGMVMLPIFDCARAPAGRQLTKKIALNKSRSALLWPVKPLHEQRLLI